MNNAWSKMYTLWYIYFVSRFLLDKLKHLRQMICGFPELDFFMYFSPELQMNLLWIYIMYRETSGERVLGIITIKIWTFWKKQFQKSVWYRVEESWERASCWRTYIQTFWHSSKIPNVCRFTVLVGCSWVRICY